MQDLLDALTTFINDAVDERIEAQMEMRLASIIEEALSSVECFDMMDHESEIIDMATEAAEAVLQNATFTVSID